MELTLPKEDGTVETSLTAIFNNLVQHGPIVGVIHRIDPRLQQSTIVFYWDGYCHEALGLSSGDSTKPTAALGLAAAVMQIPFIGTRITAEQVANNTIPNVCTQKDVEGFLKDKITTNFVYRAPEGTPFDAMSESIGAMVMDSCIEQLSQDPSGKLLQGEW